MWKTAFQFMIYDKAKLLGILFGIFISVFLIGAQLGLLDGFIESSLGIIKGNTDYIFVVNEKSESSISLANVDKRVGYELQSIEGVKKVHPVIVTGATITMASGSTFGCVLSGIQGPDFVGAPQNFQADTKLNELQNEGAVIVDELFADKVRLGMKVDVLSQLDGHKIGEGEVIFVADFLKKKSLFSDENVEEDRRVRTVKIRLNPTSKAIINARVDCIITLK